jgi:hypothetical protein
MFEEGGRMKSCLKKNFKEIKIFRPGKTGILTFLKVAQVLLYHKMSEGQVYFSRNSKRVWLIFKLFMVICQWKPNQGYFCHLCKSYSSFRYDFKGYKKRGMKYMGSTTVYSYLQAVGIYNAHEPHCFFPPESSDIMMATSFAGTN